MIILEIVDVRTFKFLHPFYPKMLKIFKNSLHFHFNFVTVFPSKRKHFPLNVEKKTIAASSYLYLCVLNWSDNCSHEQSIDRINFAFIKRPHSIIKDIMQSSIR